MKIIILNAIVLICFTILAVHFEHWWIFLFALLFLFSEKGKY